jgi:hypothetical protein
LLDVPASPAAHHAVGIEGRTFISRPEVATAARSGSDVMFTLHLRRVVLFLLVTIALACVGSAGAAASQLDVDTNRQVSRSNLSDGQLLFDMVFTSGDLRIATVLVAPDAVINTDDGVFTGPEGLVDYLDLVRPADVDGALTRTNLTVVDNLVFIDWTLERQSGPFHGLTLAVVENGQFTKIWMLDASAVSLQAVPEFAGSGDVATVTEPVSSTSPTQDCFVSCIP